MLPPPPPQFESDFIPEQRYKTNETSRWKRCHQRGRLARRSPSCWWIIHIHGVLATFHLHQMLLGKQQHHRNNHPAKGCDSKTPYTPEKLTFWTPNVMKVWFRYINFPFSRFTVISFQLSSPLHFPGNKIGAPRKMGTKEFCWFSGRNLQGLMTTCAKTKTSFLLLDAQLPTNISLLWTRGPLDLQTAPHFVWKYIGPGSNSHGRSLGRNISTLSCWFTEVCLNPTFFHESMHQALDIPYPSLKSIQTAKLVNAAKRTKF